MKILCITPWFPTHRQDQFGNYILDSIESLIDLGHEVIVLVTQPLKRQAKIQIQEFTQFELHTCRYLSIPRSYFCSFSNWSYRKFVNPIVERLIKKYQCQLIHAHTELAGVCAVDIGKKLNIPTIMTLHGISTEKKLYKGKAKKLLFEYTLSQSNRVVLVGKTLHDFFKKFIKTDQHFRIVHNGFRFHSNTEKEWSNHFRLISVSNLVEGKGIDLNLQALSKLKKQGFTHWTYQIVGDGSEKNKLMMLASQLKLTHHVQFMGRCTHDQVYEKLKNADIFVLPSYREAFGIAYVEAMSCGLLTIGVKGQGPSAFIEHGKTGFLISPNDVDELVETFKIAFESRAQIAEMARRGKEHVHQFFTWRQHALDLTKVYKELIP